jgi:rhodanese-related sulfurtransferase
VISADSLYDNLNDGDTSNDPFIVSVRSAEDYAKGHIAGAINIPWKEIAKSENLAKLPTDRQIVVYCYTGHTGQVATTVLRALGYDAVNLKFGMMGWTKNDEVLATSRFGPDTSQRDYPVETVANEATETYDYPTLSTGETDATEIVRVAADTALADWKPVMGADDLFDNLNDGDTSNDPLVVSVRSSEDYAKGHVAGAINIPWNQIANADNLAKLPTDKQIVVYCYTGHTGQVAATVLKMLGYDAVNLKFGMMGWTANDDVLATARFDPATQPDYPVEGTAVAAAADTAEPSTMPETGGAAFPLEGVLIGFGALTAAAGAYLRRRKAA